MDLRIEKTRRAIKNAFLTLLDGKKLEQITVKELCQTAQISKGTFYLHYHDLYDLCDRLQREAIGEVLSNFQDPVEVIKDLAGSMDKLRNAMDASLQDVAPLFSGGRGVMFPVLLEQELKKQIFALHPEYREDAQMNVNLSYHIFGSYYSYMENQGRFGHDRVLQMIRQTHQSLSPGIHPGRVMDSAVRKRENRGCAQKA